MNELCSYFDQLTKIPEELSKLVSLRELDISHNALKEMPDSIGELKFLVHLIANNNEISQLPKSITSLRSLQHLDLSGKYQAFNPFIFLSCARLMLFCCKECVSACPDARSVSLIQHSLLSFFGG